MGYLKKWTAVTAGATACLAGVIGIGAGLAGASQSGDPVEHSSSAAVTNATPIGHGTYEWYVNGSAAGTITIASDNTFTSTVFGTNDSGTWVQAAEPFGLFIAGGSDAGAGCVFAGHVLASNEVSYAAKPGHWACPGYSSTGTFYIGPVPPGASATQSHGNAFALRGVVPMAAGKILAGRYKWTEDGDYSGVMTIATNNTYTSTLSGDDTGTWIQSGSAASFTITGGLDSGIGCLEVGKVNHTGTAVGTSAKPGNWACPGTPSSGYFILKKKS
jgi:hypothetical protein